MPTAPWDSLWTGVDELRRVIDRLDEVVSEEYAACAAHRLEDMEAIADEKSRLGEALTTGVSDLQARLHELIGGEPATLGEWVERIDQTAALPSARARVLSARLTRLVEAFAEIKPRIEKNRFIVRELHANHIRSFSFWHEVMSELEASYGEGGSRVAKEQESVHIQVKA